MVRIEGEIVMTTLTLTETSTGTELRHGYAEVGGSSLHYVEAGEGPLVVLLHGFPEFWFGWREQIAPLAAAGFRVVAPDLRGYNLSSQGPLGSALFFCGISRALRGGRCATRRPTARRPAPRRGPHGRRGP